MNLSLSKRVNLLEQELNALKSQARMPVNMIGAGLLHDDFV
jgi:cell division protein FtsB